MRHAFRRRSCKRGEQVLRNLNMLLENKVALIYGAGGGIGAAVARAFAREGARVFLSGRNIASVDAIAADIVASGGAFETAQLDVLNEEATDEYVDSVMRKKGKIDVSFSAIGISNAGIQGIPLVQLPVDSLLLPITTYMKAHF